MLLALGLIAAGMILLVVGGEALLRGAVGLATLLKLTPAVIGLTVVAAGTSVPELAVSILAASRGSADLAVGNVVGSNIFNITAIIGLSAVVGPLAISGNTIKLEYPVLALVTLLFVAVAEDGAVSRLEAVLFISVYVGFTAYLVSLVRQQMSVHEVQEYRSELKELQLPSADGPSLLMAVLLVVAGAALLGGGAHLTVVGAVSLAEMWGMSERVIGLTIVAVGTGLPEVVTSIVSSFRGRDDVAIANVLGSNLFNILAILGISALVTPLPVAAGIVSSDNWWMLGVTLLLFPLMFTGRRVNRWEACLLLSVYAFYLAWLLTRPA
jgi:cation:H+ antiporter